MRCRVCRQPGHNRASCPTVKARIEELRAAYGSDHYSVANYDAKRQSSKTKTCTYCAGEDHNRRNCSIIKQDRIRLSAVQASYRRRYIAALIETGFVPGSVVKRTNVEHFSRQECHFDTLHLVVGANLSNINFDNYGVVSLESKFLGGEIPSGFSDWQIRGFKHHQVIPGFGNNIKADLASNYRRFRPEHYEMVIAAGCPDTFLKSLPKTFVEGTDNLDHYFENKRGSFGRTHNQFVYSIEPYEETSRFDWLENNAVAYSSTVQDEAAYQRAIEANRLHVGL